MKLLYAYTTCHLQEVCATSTCKTHTENAGPGPPNMFTTGLSQPHNPPSSHTSLTSVLIAASVCVCVGGGIPGSSFKTGFVDLEGKLKLTPHSGNPAFPSIRKVMLPAPMTLSLAEITDVFIPHHSRCQSLRILYTYHHLVVRMVMKPATRPCYVRCGKDACVDPNFYMSIMKF